MTRTVRSSDLWWILVNRIPLQELQATRISALQVQRQTFVYNGTVNYLQNLLSAQAVARAARDWLIRTGSVSNILEIPYYEYFAGYASFHLSANPASAQAEIEALFSQFVSWGYNANILRAIAFFQGVVISSN